MSETKQIRAYLSDAEARALNARAAERGVTRAWLITQALATAPVTRDLFTKNPVGQVSS